MMAVQTTRVYSRRSRRASAAGLEAEVGYQDVHPMQKNFERLHFTRRSSTPNAFAHLPPDREVHWLPPSGMNRRQRQRSATPTNENTQAGLRRRPSHQALETLASGHVPPPPHHRGRHTLERSTFPPERTIHNSMAPQQGYYSLPQQQRAAEVPPRKANMSRRASSSGLEAMTPGGYFWRYASHKLEGDRRQRPRRSSNPGLENMDLDEINWRTGQPCTGQPSPTEGSQKQHWHGGESSDPTRRHEGAVTRGQQQGKSNAKKKNTHKQKMRQLNQKEKEGSDMDAFTDQGAATPVVGDVPEAAKVEVNGLTSPSAEEEAAAEAPAAHTAHTTETESTKPSGATSAPPSKDSRDSMPRELTPEPPADATPAPVAVAETPAPVPTPAPAPPAPAAEDSSMQAPPRDNTPTPPEGTHTDRQSSADRDTSVKDKDVRNQNVRDLKEQELNKSVEKQPSADSEIKESKESKDVLNSAADVSRTAPPASEERPSTDNKEADNKVSELNEKNDTKHSAAGEKTLDNKSDNSETVIKKPEPARSKLIYKDDQWSPGNREGKKQYDRSFLLQLQYATECLGKPEGLPPLPEVILDKPITQDLRNDDMFSSRQSGMADFMPRFFKSAPSGGDRRGPGGMGGRSRSQQKPRDDRDRDRGNKNEPRKVISISIGQDVKLHQTENAWKPQPLNKTANVPKDEEMTDEVETAEILKKVRSILNKLTPQKFQTLLEQIRSLKINTPERLNGAIDLIFEKALDEPNFSVAYARLCKSLNDIKVESPSGEEKISFTKLLLQRCQSKFQNDYLADINHAARVKEIEAAPEDKKKELQTSLDYDEMKARRRSIGNIRFIGELFKWKMLTTTIMQGCIQKLLVPEEESLECLCRLLATIGKNFDVPEMKSNVDNFFVQIDKFSKDRKVSSRVRFMLLDLIDLRQNAWKPRREDNNPKTIDQIHKEAQQEDAQKSMMVEQYNMQQKQRGGGGRQRGPPQGFGAPNQSDDGWQAVGKNNRNANSMDPGRMRLTRHEVNDNIQLGPGGRGFGSWGQGSRGGTGGAAGASRSSSMEGERPPPHSNRFAALSGRNDSYDRQRRGMSGDKSRLSTPSRGKNITRSSQEKDRDSAISAARNIVGVSRTPSSPMGSRNQSRESSRNRNERDSSRGRDDRDSSRGRQDRESSSGRGEPAKASASPEISMKVMEKKSKAILEEYLGIRDLKEALQCVQELESASTIHMFVYTCFAETIEKGAKQRHMTGSLLYELVSRKVLSIDVFYKGSAEFLQYADDMHIDIPKIWAYLGELMGPMIQEGDGVPLAFLKPACSPLLPCKKAAHTAAEVLKEAVSRLGEAAIATRWAASGLQWSDFLPADKNVAEFLKDHKLEMLGTSSSSESILSMEKISVELDRAIVQNAVSNKDLIDWIDKNVGAERASEPAFIRALTTAICTSALKGADCSDLDLPKLQLRVILFMKYLDHKAPLELQALFALQALMVKLDHPSGLLKKFFDVLYDEDIMYEDIFHMWNDDTSEMQGKGVAKASVQQFFQWLAVAEEEEQS